MTGDLPFAEIDLDEQSQNRDDAQTVADDDVHLPAVAPQQGHFGFTLRELIIIGAWLLAFVLSFVPGAGSILDITSTVWTMNGAWVLMIGVPTAATFLIVLRRLSPDGIRRVGSLGIDQFASVAYSVAAVSWAVLLWQQVVLVGATRQSLLMTWPAWVEIILMLALVAVTVFAGLFPALREDFEGRMETLAHRNADPVRPVFSKPRPVRARGSVSDPQSDDDVDPGLLHEGEVVAAAHVSGSATGAPSLTAPGYVPEQHRESFLASDATDEAGAAPHAEAPLPDATPEDASTVAIVDAPVEPDASDETDEVAHAPSDTMTQVLGDLLEPTPADDVATHSVDVVPPAPERRGGKNSSPAEPAQPFWALAPEVRPVHDAQGDEIFRIGPDAWILVLEDRGGAFVVRHDDGRVGYLHDTENMTRG
ncbi:hypothetical protein [Microbacterium panaciterrae]|uniref:Uncharacterized protein n=1 Tax=Microbacterium panaciterrae TaxID=985759 RepID=A0ABP8PN71_9MICO